MLSLSVFILVVGRIERSLGKVPVVKFRLVCIVVVSDSKKSNGPFVMEQAVEFRNEEVFRHANVNKIIFIVMESTETCFKAVEYAGRV